MNAELWLVLVTMVPAALVAAIVLYPIRRFADRLGLLDQPGGHSTHVQATPLGGGLGIYLGVAVTFAVGAVAVLALQDQSVLIDSTATWLSVPSSYLSLLPAVTTKLDSLVGLMIGGTVLVALGFWDDRQGVSPWIRLAVQFAVAAMVVLGLGFELTAFISAPWVTKPLSIVWIVAVINSFNMLDNMDGLSAGVAAIIAGSMAAVMLSTPNPKSGQPQYLVASLLLVTAGALIGFLWHNRPPAKIFMGDAGSYFVGYMISVAMLIATFAGDGGQRPHAVLAPLCVMAVPMYDMLTVIWIRIRSGRSIFVGDRSHFSHRLVDLGLSRTQAVVTIYLVTATCGLAAVLLTGISVYQAWMVLGIVGCMLLLVVILESTSWRRP